MKRRVAGAAAALGVVIAPVLAQSQTHTYTPASANGNAQMIAVDGNTVDLTGSVQFTSNAFQNAVGYTLINAYNQGLLTPLDGAIDPNGQITLSLGAKNNGVAVHDSVTNGKLTVNTYSFGSIMTTVPGPALGINFYRPTPAGQEPFVQAGIATVTNGGTFNFDATGQVGDARTKDTVYIRVNDGTANWSSANAVAFATPNAATTLAQVTRTNQITATTTTFNGTFTVNTTDGPVSQTVNNLDDLKAYNNWLIGELQAGKLGDYAVAQANYDAAIALAYANTDSTYTYQSGIGTFDPNDPLFRATGTVVGMLADGANAKGNVTSTGMLKATGGGGGTLLKASNGGSITNEGKVVSHRWVTGIQADTGGHVINNGVRSLGDYNGDRTLAVYALDTYADNITGTGTTYVNNGTVNLAIYNDPAGSGSTSPAYWLTTQQGAEGTNNGTVNVGVNTPTSAGQPVGVLANNQGSFVNSDTGVIYLGREKSLDVSSDPIARGGADVAQQNGAVGLRVQSNGSVRNDGSIVIGDLVQKGIGIEATGANVNVLNNGTITVNGHYSATPQANIGIYSSATSGSVVNDGIIDLLGVNNIGIQAQSGGIATSSGTINVTGAIDPATGLRNYGIWSEGRNTAVSLSGEVNLTGDGAIGVHARNGGKVVIDGGSVNFEDGASNQIGYFSYGVGSEVKNTGAGTQNVSAENSTLIRIDGGAAFDGDVNTARSTLTASGENSTAVVASGYTGGNVSKVNSGRMTVDLTGAGATGVLIEGGAQGKITSDATIRIDDSNAVGAVAAVVDGQQHDISGVAVGNPIAGALADASKAAGEAGFGTGTILVSEATLTSGIDGVTGYISRNQGQFQNNGDITFTGANTTGMQVESQSRGGNAGSINIANGTGVKVLNGKFQNDGTLTANGTGIYMEGANATVTNNGQILATNGRAAIEIGNGASLVIGTESGVIEGRGSAHAVLIDAGATQLKVDGAHIVVDAANATGNGIENAGEISDLQLTDTTIDVANGAGIRTGVSPDGMNNASVNTINVSGSGTGIAFQNADGSATSANLDLSSATGLVINANGAGANGIVANTSGTVSTAATIQVDDVAGGSALVLSRGVAAATNSGTLVSTSATSAVVAANDVVTFTNTATGVITAKGRAAAVKFGDQASALTNQGLITGLVDMGKGNDTLLNAGTIDGDVTAAEGDNSMIVDGGTVTGDIALTGATGTNSVLLQNGATIHTFSGSGGTDTVTVKGAGNTFDTLNGGTGTATLAFDAAPYTLVTSSSINDFDQVNLRNASVVTLQTVLNDAAVDIDGSSTLAVDTDGAYALANKLTGTGLVTTSTNANAFDFASSAGSDFAGTVAIRSSTFALGGVNTTALTNATLRADTGSVTTVADGDQAIGGLAFNGGKVIFNATAPEQLVATSTISTSKLDASGTGTVQIQVPTPYVPQAPDASNTANLLEQDDTDVGVKLVNATTTIGSGGALALVDQNGDAITDSRQIDIAQGGNTVAVGTYDYRLTTAPGDGLYVNYGLTQLDIQNGQTLTLAQDTGAAGASADMSARITGNGNLEISAGSGAVGLSNALNDYRGDTTVSSGTLRLEADNAMGQTETLHIASGATTDLNGYAQTIDTLDGQAGSTLAFNDGALTIANGGSSLGELTGGGLLHIADGTLEVHGANTGMSADTTIAASATARLDNAAGLGNGELVNEGVLALEGASGELANNMSGAGLVALSNGANVKLAGDNSNFAGTFDIVEGTALAASSQQNLGTAAILAEGMLALDGYDDTLANSVTGTGVVALSNASNVTVSGDNSDFGGTFDISRGTTLTASSQQNLGTATIADEGTLALEAYEGTLANTVSGAGVVALSNAADVTVVSDNSGFAGQFDIGAGSRLEVTTAQNLGTASVANAGDLVVNTATDWTLDNAVTGAGTLTKDGEGTLNVGNGLAYTGETRVAAGTLIVGDALNPNRALGAAGAGEVTVDTGATLAGLGTVNGHVTNAGTISALNALSAQASAPAGDFTLAGGLTNAGMVNLAGASVGNRLVVKGDYVGQNGTVVINTELSGDHSATDKLVIDGGNASGSTALRVQKTGGNGAQTNVGIRVVETANGGTTEAQAFELDPGSTGYRNGVGTLSAGGYDYGLKRGGNGGEADDWYLVSASDTVPGGKPSVGVNTEASAPPAASELAVSPEVGAYLANRSAATGALMHSLHDRKGQASVEGQGDDSLGWGRIEGRQSSRTGVGGLNIENTDRLLHGGIDLLHSSDSGEGSVRAGVMAAYVNSSSSSTSRLLGATATGSVEGYGLGGYATWYGNRDRDTGPYADAYVMFGGFDNKVGGGGLQTDSYRSRVVTGSLEGGYSFKVYEDGKTNVYVVPQAQVVASNYRADAHVANGTNVGGMNGTDLTTRLGVRVHTKTETGKGTNLRPFVELNWLRGPASQNLAMDANQFRDEMPANRIETKVGVESQVTKQLSAWGSVGAAAGSKNYSSLSGQIGIKYTW